MTKVLYAICCVNSEQRTQTKARANNKYIHTWLHPNIEQFTLWLIFEWQPIVLECWIQWLCMHDDDDEKNKKIPPHNQLIIILIFLTMSFLIHFVSLKTFPSFWILLWNNIFFSPESITITGLCFFFCVVAVFLFFESYRFHSAIQTTARINLTH